MKRTLTSILFAAAHILVTLALVTPAPASAKDNLVIGITQFPATFHPNIENMAAKTYVLSAVRRPITPDDPDWNLACFLCVELPTLENGQAKLEKTPDG